MAIPGLLKITVFWSKGYEDIIPVDDVINKTLSRELNYIVDVFMFMWSLVTLAFLWEKLSQPQFYKDLTGRNASLSGGLG